MPDIFWPDGFSDDVKYFLTEKGNDRYFEIS